MTVFSMTGYGRREIRSASLSVSVEIRSVNHRYFETSMRLPGVLVASEQKVREIVQASLSRGRVSIAIDVNNREETEEYVPDEKKVRAYLSLAKRLKKEYRIGGELDVQAVLNLPDVMSRRTREVRSEEVWPVAAKGIEGALVDLLKMRQREGRALAADLKKRIRLIRSTLVRIEKHSGRRSARVKAELEARMRILLDGTPVSEEKLVSEAAFLADKMDCAEEIVRARSHLEQFLLFLKEGGPIGRKLNFLLQELHREINTIGSKANDKEIARDVVLLKEEVERLREQVQNLE